MPSIARRAASTPDSVGSGPSIGPCGPPSAGDADERLELAQQPRLAVVADEPRRAGPTAANAPGPTWTEQPVTTISASGFARRARRTAARDFSSAVAVTVQVLTRTRSAAPVRVDERHRRPRAAAAPPPPSRTG